MQVKIERGGVELSWQEDEKHLTIQTGGKTFRLLLNAAVDTPEKTDPLTRWTLGAQSREGDADMLVFRATYSLWRKKEFEVLITNEEILFRAAVQGEGAVQQVRFFYEYTPVAYWDELATMHRIRGGRESARSHILGSPLEFPSVFSPQPDHYDLPAQPSSTPRRLTCATTFGPEIFNTFFAPSVYCYVLGGYMSVGLAAATGENTYNHFDYVTGDGWGLRLNYDGMTKVNGDWRSAWVRIAPAADDEAGVAGYLEYLRRAGLAPRPVDDIPVWTREPVFCGWGQQVAWGNLAASQKCPEGSPITPGARENCTQELYEKMVALLDEANLPYGTLIIDFGWSLYHSLPVANTLLWPDLKGFIRKLHAKGKRVLLWLSAWNPGGGLPERYLMERDAGVGAWTDPGKPAFRQELIRMITQCISSDGYDADGFKLDFTGDQPRGAGYRPAGGNWGLEIMLDYLRVIHGAMKAAKADSALETHCPAPQVVGLCQMLRLNDIFSVREDIRGMMRFRARMAALVNPHWPIDTDNSPFASKQAWLDYLRMQPQIGVPSLYTLTHMEYPGAGAGGAQAEVTAGELAELAALWREYRKAQRLS